MRRKAQDGIQEKHTESSTSRQSGIDFGLQHSSMGGIDAALNGRSATMMIPRADMAMKPNNALHRWLRDERFLQVSIDRGSVLRGV